MAFPANFLVLAKSVNFLRKLVSAQWLWQEKYKQLKTSIASGLVRIKVSSFHHAKIGGLRTVELTASAHN